MSSKSYAACNKVNKLRRLNERGNRQIQAMHAADGEKLGDLG
jgi:hypothetical protein